MSVEIPNQGRFDGPFYEQRRKLQNHDKRDNRVGSNPYPPRLDRLVTFADNPNPLDPDVHAGALRRTAHIVHQDRYRFEGGDYTPHLGTRIRDKHALHQEITAGVTTMPMEDIQLLVAWQAAAQQRRKRGEGGDAQAA